MQGHSDIPLNSYGRELAEITARALAEVHFDQIFCSPLIRAVETARIIAGDRDCRFEIDERIQEIGFGEYEGLYFKKDKFNIPNENFGDFFDAPQRYIAPPGGESIEDVLRRTGGFWRELAEDPDYTDKTVLISTHGCALKGLLANIFHKEVREFWGKGVQKNCAVTIVRVAEGKTELLVDGKVFY